MCVCWRRGFILLVVLFVPANNNYGCWMLRCAATLPPPRSSKQNTHFYHIRNFIIKDLFPHASLTHVLVRSVPPLSNPFRLRVTFLYTNLLYSDSEWAAPIKYNSHSLSLSLSFSLSVSLFLSLSLSPSLSLFLSPSLLSIYLSIPHSLSLYLALPLPCFSRC